MQPQAYKAVYQQRVGSPDASRRVEGCPGSQDIAYRMYALLGACFVSAAHACEICQHKLFSGGCPVGRRKARERWGDWVVTDDAFDDGDCQKTCCAANEKSCCETDFNFVAGVAGGLFVLIAICVVVCCVECRRRRALGRVVRKRAAPPFEGERV